MAALKFKQEIVKIRLYKKTKATDSNATDPKTTDPKDKTNENTAKGTINEYYINVEDVDWTEKMDSDEYSACNSVEPYAVAFGKKEYSIDFKGVDPDQRYIFEAIMAYQRNSTNTTGVLPSIVTYRYNSAHKVIADKYFKQCYIEEISQTTQEPFDVKFKALKMEN